jgi:transcriptional regulator with XRE-family HTH domain
MYTKSHHVNDVVTIRRQAWGGLLGGGIEEARELAGLSIEQAAEAAGMEASEWRAIEAGHAPDDQDRLLAMADAIDVPHDQMALYAFLCQGAWQR